MRQVKRTIMLVAAVALVMAAFVPFAGAVDNGGTPVPPAIVLGGVSAAAVPADVSVGLFFDSSYVDTATDGGGEAYNLQQTLLDQGFVVNTFTGVTTAEWTAAIAANDVIVIPELENGNLAGNAEPGVITALQDFMSAGGRVLVNYGGSSTRELLETIFELTPGSITLGNQNCPCTKTAAAAGTEWADGPTTIQNMDATGTLDVTTGPAGTTAIYADDDDADEAGIALLPINAGGVVYIAWDWYFDEGEAAEMPAWFSVLGASVLGPQPAPAPTPAPEPEPVVVAPRFTG